VISRDIAPQPPKPDGWVSAALDAAIDVLVAEGEPFTADRVHADRFGIGGLRRGDVGAAFRRASLQRRIRPIGFECSRRSGRRSSVVRVWVGAARGGDVA